MVNFCSLRHSWLGTPSAHRFSSIHEKSKTKFSTCATTPNPLLDPPKRSTKKFQESSSVDKRPELPFNQICEIIANCSSKDFISQLDSLTARNQPTFGLTTTTCNSKDLSSQLGSMTTHSLSSPHNFSAHKILMNPNSKDNKTCVLNLCCARKNRSSKYKHKC